MPGGRTLRAGLLALVPAAALFAIGYAGIHSPGAPEASAAQPAPAPAAFKLEKGDHICIIGNTLAERMQHDGWLETYLHARFPQHDLTIRNLGFSGDEVDATGIALARTSAPPDQWLAGNAPIPQAGRRSPTRASCNRTASRTTNTKADVIFAFFGYNESFAGEAGLPKFKTDLDSVHQAHAVAEVQRQVGPAAGAVLADRVRGPQVAEPADGDGAINKNLELYTKAMGEVAKANGVPLRRSVRPDEGRCTPQAADAAAPSTAST